MATEAEIRQDAEDMGLEGDMLDMYLKHHLAKASDAPKSDAVPKEQEAPPTTTPPPKPKADRVAALGVVKKSTPSAAKPAPKSPAASDFETSYAPPEAPEAFDVDVNGRPTGLVQQFPDTKGMATIPAAATGLRERPPRSPQAQASDFRPQLSPVSSVMHAVDPATTNRGVPPVGYPTKAAPSVLPAGTDARRQMIADALGLPSAAAYKQPAAPTEVAAVAPADTTAADYEYLVNLYPKSKDDMDARMKAPGGADQIREMARRVRQQRGE